MEYRHLDVDFEKLEQVKKEKNFGEKYYQWLSLLGSFSFATWMMIQQTQLGDEHISSLNINQPQFIGYFIYYWIVWLGKRFYYQSSTNFQSHKLSLFYIDGQFNKNILYGVIFRGVNIFLTQIIQAIIIMYSIECNINPATVMSFQSFTSFFCATLFYIVFKEKLLPKHIFGCIILVISVLVLGVSKSDNQDLLNKWALIQAFLFLLLLVCIITFNQLQSRIFLTNGMNIIDFSATYLFISGICEMFFFIYQHFFVYNYSNIQIIIMTFASSFQFFGQILMNYCVLYGKVGIVQAIINTQTIVYLLMQMIYYQFLPNIIEVLSLSIALIGAIVISI